MTDHVFVGEVYKLDAFEPGEDSFGLDQATEARLFGAFSRGANAEHVQGLGLGLFISHQIVEQHGGTIQAAAGAGGIGSEFRVWLPKDAA